MKKRNLDYRVKFKFFKNSFSELRQLLDYTILAVRS